MNYDQQSQIMTLSMWTVKNTMFCCCSCWKCGLENGFIYSLIKNKLFRKKRLFSYRNAMPNQFHGPESKCLDTCHNSFNICINLNSPLYHYREERSLAPKFPRSFTNSFHIQSLSSSSFSLSLLQDLK